MSEKTKYIPGVCNIGPTEKRRRARVGWMGLIGLVVLAIVLYAVDASPRWRLLLFLPAVVMTGGWLQALLNFCASFGLSGVFKLGNDQDKADTVIQAEFRKKDYQKAWLIIILSVVIAAGITGVLWWL